MIGVITLISVQERTKEIGILRAMGASKRDVSRVFNAETLIIGLAAGLMGIGITLLLNIPINAIIQHLAGVDHVAQLPLAGGVILVAISVILTVLAGLIPAKAAAKKDPVEALRTE
jgi:putative ABC transport system permease protein